MQAESSFKVACSNCNLRELCLPIGLSTDEMNQLDGMVATRKKVKQGGHLFSSGDPFTTLYAIRTGFFKTCVVSEDGREQVTGFQMAGEIMGLDGIVSDRPDRVFEALARKGLKPLQPVSVPVPARR